MESQEKFCDSLPYIDDTTTADDDNPHQYNVKIIENYHNKNRNIEITNRLPSDTEKSLSPPAPLADDTEFSDNKLSDSTEEKRINHERRFRIKESGMKLVIKGWNSSVSIQGLDNESSITFKRRCEKAHKKLEKNKTNNEEQKVMEKSRKGKWKMLTRSIMLAKSARFERKGLDERYPKYVLLKNEEEELTTVKENYPKMFVLSEGSSKQKRNSEPKTDFSFKKSFKNKTEPIVPLNNILGQNEQTHLKKPRTKLTTEDTKLQKKALTERNVRKKKTVERKKNLSPEKNSGRSTQNITVYPFCHGQMYNEIQNIIEDTLQLSPQNTEMKQGSEVQHQDEKLKEYHTSVPPQFTCHGPYCCAVPHSQTQHQAIRISQNVQKSENANTQFQSQLSCESQEIGAEDPTAIEGVIDLESLPYGILSSFFPRVVIMNAISSSEIQGEKDMTTNRAEYKISEEAKKVSEEDVSQVIESLELPQRDLTLKSKIVQEVKQFKPQDMEDFSLKEISELDEDQNTKSQDSVTTEYLQYSELDPPENESVEHSNPIISHPKDDSEDKECENLPPVDKFKIVVGDENSENLSLTKIGYKMYDNLTKLSLNREKEMSKKAEASGCGCNGNGTKKSPYNITLESNNSVVKVTVPENELNFQIFNSEGRDIQIGVMSGEKEKKSGEEMKKVVRKDELWHTDNERRALVLKNENSETGSSQKFKVSLADNKEVVLSIELNEKEKKEENIKEKLTREMKVGTDDFDLAGGDFVSALDGSYQNLSPRIGQLLKLLHEKLEADGKERKFWDEKINEKLIDQKYQRGILPGYFLVKHISPRPHASKKPSEVPSVRKSKSESREFSGQLREYYCEECLATMRIFEDENPSVKSMVDKFETIIQLESY